MDFKLSDNQKYNMIWTLLNSRFNEENGYVLDYGICEVYDDYAIVFSVESQGYERAYYTKDDESDSLTIDKMEACYIVDVNDEEKRALEVLHAMNNNTYEKIDEVVNGLKEEIETFNSKNEENEATISTLQQDKEALETENEQIKADYEASQETIANLTSENESLQTYKADIELKEKEAVIEKYVTLLEPATIEDFTNKIADFTKEELDKELAFVLVQTKANIFTNNNDEGGFVPKDEETLTGVEATLSRYKSKKN